MFKVDISKISLKYLILCHIETSGIIHRKELCDQLIQLLGITTEHFDRALDSLFKAKKIARIKDKNGNSYLSLNKDTRITRGLV